MYILSIIVVIVGTCIVSLVSGVGIMDGAIYINLSSFILLVILTIPTLVASRLSKDFNNAFQLSMKKSVPNNMGEIKRAIEAVDLMMKIILVAGSLIALIAFVVILRTADDLSAVGPKMTIAFLSLIYALCLDLFLLPLRSRLRVKLQEFIEQE